ncbi:fumarylacetoacetate hydrolase family protein [Acidaminobacter hydrogenoformans]|uniref:2-keto-4-pentenoate hydratase/2-oxohepta-3-ene-1,7-dioic acid hydratase (Catechol pathway) n=1 Tax=Acidaminobacter hydrogenoformans DSM 2784 TaxID=1120920 RepID=A0A1G5S7I6_9FIRM|nr:fumarylacetoacetate hydrolase family protein [Acidaminobacter hydrogenoformans]SCZ81549.1 2-keto-4-pentenoate hydratase/2-oxohepta-3-ene-1,7-dioic acid hydratase (catechol pathway) [Acidaminobacter hydrogenoformans DSM 2784]
MRLVTINCEQQEIAGVVTPKGIITIAQINQLFSKSWEIEMFPLITKGQIPEMTHWYNSGGKAQLEALTEEAIPFEQAIFAPLYRYPAKIFGIGLNYKNHAADLSEKAPETFPASFYKPATAIIGHGDTIVIPVQSEKTTGEAELGVIMGRECENIEPAQWLDYVAGFTTIIDMTAEDILRQNPRYLTMAKSFNTFISFGPQLITPDEIEDIMRLKVRTVHNGEVYAENTVSNMTFPPDFLVAFHSKVFKWLPGDILSTGTPRAVHIQQGDTIECQIDGFMSLTNPVSVSDAKG